MRNERINEKANFGDNLFVINKELFVKVDLEKQIYFNYFLVLIFLPFGLNFLVVSSELLITSHDQSHLTRPNKTHTID